MDSLLDEAFDVVDDTYQRYLAELTKPRLRSHSKAEQALHTEFTVSVIKRWL